MLNHSERGAAVLAAILVVAAGGVQVVRGERISRFRWWLLLLFVGVFVVLWMA